MLPFSYLDTTAVVVVDMGTLYALGIPVPGDRVLSPHCLALHMRFYGRGHRAPHA